MGSELLVGGLVQFPAQANFVTLGQLLMSVLVA